jgi:uncharacterized protein (DUF433 family)
MQQNLINRITVNPKQCGGRPCVRGMRIRVSDVLDLFAAGLSKEDILVEMPDLEMEDLQACLQFASRRLDHPIIAAGQFFLLQESQSPQREMSDNARINPSHYIVHHHAPAFRQLLQLVGWFNFCDIEESEERKRNDGPEKRFRKEKQADPLADKLIDGGLRRVVAVGFFKQGACPNADHEKNEDCGEEHRRL